MGLALMSAVYVFAGILHFAKPRIFVRIVPPYLPWPKLLVYLSGAAEIILGLMLWVPELSRWAAWGIVALLIAVFPANLYMHQKGGKAFEVPSWLLAVRLPVQLLLIAWAYVYTR